MKADLLNDAFKRAATAAGFPVGREHESGLTLHSLRSFFKSHAIMAGVPREIVDTWQGHHTDRSVGFRHYFNLTLQDSIRFMQQINFNSRGE